MKGEESVSRVMVVTEQTTGESIVMHDVCVLTCLPARGGHFQY
jgi:hypothetical protein